MRNPLGQFIDTVCHFMAPKIYAAADHRWARAVRRGLLTCLPLVILGAAAVLFNHLPIAAYQDAMLQLFGANWKHIPEHIWQATFGIIALAMTAAISYALASNHASNRDKHTTATIISGVALASFFALIYQDNTASIVEMLGNRGAFAAICNAIIATELFLWLQKKYHVPVNWFGHDADPALSHALAALLPGISTIVLIFALGQGWHSLNLLMGNQLQNLLLTPFSNPDNLGITAIAMLFLIHSLWFFGIHGNIAMDPLSQAHFEAGKNAASGWIPTEVFSKTFYDVFVYQGGAGCTLALLIAVLLVRRNSGTRRIAKVAFPCALINVNEPVLFGFPVVLNPFYLIPFILTPVILFTSGMLAISLGLVPPPSITVEWTTPPLLGGWIATDSWRGAALQLFNLALATLIYLPFVRLAEKASKIQNAKTFNALVQVVSSGGQQYAIACLQGRDQLSNLARLLNADLQVAAQNGQLYLEYQPLTDYAGNASGVEALLRWHHPVYGQVPPVLAIYLAEQSGVIVDVGRWVIAEACRQLGEWNRAGIVQKKMSINLSPRQLGDDGLPEFIQESINTNKIKAHEISLEITETGEIQDEHEAKLLLNRITALGVKLTLDDFGMGYSSILYLRRFPISTIKVDGSLTRDVVTDQNCQEIIMSIASLCSSTHVEIVAEYVETREQLKMLYGLGCHAFQGFLFSEALPAAQCAAYLQQHHIDPQH